MWGIVRRLVARTIAQSMSAEVRAATSPFQDALTTKSGGECVAHAIQSFTDLSRQATVLTIDGISAYDSISRAAMMDGLSNVNGGNAVLPFMLQFIIIIRWTDSSFEDDDIKKYINRRFTLSSHKLARHQSRTKSHDTFSST